MKNDLVKKEDLQNISEIPEARLAQIVNHANELKNFVDKVVKFAKEKHLEGWDIAGIEFEERDRYGWLEDEVKVSTRLKEYFNLENGQIYETKLKSKTALLKVVGNTEENRNLMDTLQEKKSTSLLVKRS